MTTEAQKKASAKYDKEHTRSVMLKFNLTGDADILSKLDAVSNKQGYIKNLVRQDIRGSGECLPIDAIKTLLLPVENTGWMLITAHTGMKDCVLRTLIRNTQGYMVRHRLHRLYLLWLPLLGRMNRSFHHRVCWTG